MAEAKKGSGGMFVLLLSFLVVAFVLFDPGMRALLSGAVGAVFDPLFGFGGRHPFWTVALAGVTMILLSTVIRHFLVDWVKMARVQEVMRHFQKEFREAQKANNSYKVKRLTEAQPDIMKLQADMSGEQLKPMAFTMIIIIPIFIWLSAFMLEPVHYDVEYEGSGSLLLVGYGDDLWDAEIAHPDEPARLDFFQNAHVHALALQPGSAGAVRLAGETGEVSFRVDDAPPLPAAAGERVNLTRGDYSVRTVDNLDMWSAEEPAKLNKALLLVLQPDGRVGRVVVARPEATAFSLAEDATVLVLAPAPPNAAPRGNPLQVHVEGPTRARVDVHAEDVLLLPTLDGEATLTPKAIRMPWNPVWDLNVNWWFLPRWILLYSLVSIPLGTATQKLLKKWEFQRVDLDQDGIPAGKHL